MDDEARLAKFATEHPDHYMLKFCRDVPQWRFIAKQIARSLKLDSGKPLRILDIGCGFGYFIEACREMGHDVIGIDRTEEIIKNACEILKVYYIPHEIKPCIPLPLNLSGFDLVTIFGVNLRYQWKVDEYWGWADYSYLAADIRLRLRENGRWILRPNRGSHDKLLNLYRPRWWKRVAPQATVHIQHRHNQVVLQWPE